MIEQTKKAAPIRQLCRLLGVSHSAYYARQAKQKTIDVARVRLRTEVQAIARESGDSYGSRRIAQALCRRGHKVGRYRAASLMREAGVVANVPKPHRYRPSGPPAHVAPNRLDRQFEVATPNTAWAGDITYIATHKGWAYLAIVLDLCSRRVVGWAFSDTPDTNLVIRALFQALQVRPRGGTLMFHSDQGCQYTSQAFRDYLRKQGITQSMSRRGNCWDNAVVERFFRSLKTERTRYVPYADHAQAKADITDYIATFYNHQRLHSSANNLPPALYEASLSQAA